MKKLKLIRGISLCLLTFSLASPVPVMAKSPAVRKTTNTENEIEEYPHVSAKYYEAYDLTTGQELLGKRENERMYPASITKVLYTEVLLDRIKDKDLDEMAGEVKATDNVKAAENGLYRSGLSGGEEVTYRDLLHSILFMSGAEACYASARIAFGSEKNAVKAMNEKADGLGMSHSHFVNITGMHSDRHYTTCDDFTKVMAAAWKNKTIRGIMSESRYSTSDKKHIFVSPVSRAKDICQDNLIGGKTGTTDPAQHTFAGFSNVKGHIVTIITGKSPLSISSSHIRDATAIAKFVKENYELHDVPSEATFGAYKYTVSNRTQVLMRNEEFKTYEGDHEILLKSEHQTVRLSASRKQIDLSKVQKGNKSDKQNEMMKEITAEGVVLLIVLLSLIVAKNFHDRRKS